MRSRDEIEVEFKNIKDKPTFAQLNTELLMDIRDLLLAQVIPEYRAMIPGKEELFGWDSPYVPPIISPISQTGGTANGPIQP